MSTDYKLPWRVGEADRTGVAWRYPVLDAENELVASATSKVDADFIVAKANGEKVDAERHDWRQLLICTRCGSLVDYGKRCGPDRRCSWCPACAPGEPWRHGTVVEESSEARRLRPTTN